MESECSLKYEHAVGDVVVWTCSEKRPCASELVHQCTWVLRTHICSRWSRAIRLDLIKVDVALPDLASAFPHVVCWSDFQRTAPSKSRLESVPTVNEFVDSPLVLG